MQQTDFAFANNIRAAVELRTPRTSHMLLIASLAMLFTGIIWAHFALLNEVKRGNGRVAASRQTQVVQSLEGGIVEEFLVQEGAIVQQEQPLIRINDIKFVSEFGEVRERRAAIAARVARLQAEAQGRDKVTFPPELINMAPAAVAAEASVFDARTRKLAQEIDVFTQQEIRLTEDAQKAIGNGTQTISPCPTSLGRHYSEVAHLMTPDRERSLLPSGNERNAPPAVREREASVSSWLKQVAGLVSPPTQRF